MKKIILKIILYAAASFTLLLVTAVLLVVLLIYGRLNNQIARVINNQSEKLMNGRLTVGSLEGRLFEGFTLNRILITHEDDTIVYVGSWQTQYKLKSLFQRKIHISSISVDDLIIRVEQYSDSVWNFLKLIPEQENEPADTTSEPFSWEIALDDFYLNRLDLFVQTLDTLSLIPDKVQARIHLQFAMKEREMKIKLVDSKIITTKPDLQADHLSFNLTLIEDSLTMNQFTLHLPQTQMTAQASLDLSSPENLSARLTIPSLSFDDFREFLGDVPLYGKPSLEITAENRSYTIGIVNRNQEISMKAWLSGIDSLAEYTASAGLKNLNLAEWTRDPELKSNVTGTIEVSGTGSSIAENQINTSVRLPVLEFAGYSASLQMSARKKGTEVDGRLNANSKIGKINSYFGLNEIFKTPAYQLNANISELNLSELSGDTLLTSDLHFNIGINGKGTDPDRIQIAAGIQSGFGTIAGIELDTLAIIGQYNRGRYDLKEFLVQTSPFLLKAYGEGDINGSHHVGYQLKMNDISSLGQFLGADSLALEGFAEGTLSGTLQDAAIAQKIRLNNVQFNDIKLDSLHISLAGFIQDTLYTGTLEARLMQIQLPGFQVDRLGLHSVYDGQQLKNELHVSLNGESRAEAQFFIRPDETLTIKIPHLSLIYKDINWLGKADSLSFNTENNQVTASGISFESGEQKIDMGGSFSPADSIYAFFRVNNLDFVKFPSELFSGFKPEGKTDFFAGLSGSAAAPQLEAGLEITGFRLDSLTLDTIRTNLFYNDDAFLIKGSVDGYGTSLVRFDGILPFHLSMTDSIYVLDSDERLSLDVVSTLQNLQPFSGFFPEGIALDGSSDIRVRIKNSLKNPDLEGSIRFENGFLRYPQYGIDLRNLQLTGNLGQMRLQLDSLRMESGRGFLKMDGFVQIKGLDTLAIQSFGLNMQSNRFTVTNGPHGEIVVNSRLMIQGNPETAEFNGRMTIEQGLIHIDAIMSQFGMVADDPNPPLLLQAIDQSQEQVVADSLILFEPAGIASAAFNNLKGEMDVDIPGNFWVRGKDMNFEMGGNLRAIAEGGQVDLFGSLDIRRGHYTVYGKRLVVNTGKIELTGGREVNPILDVEIGYVFRDHEKQLRNLTIGITGRALQPTIAFQIDAERIEEKDGISYLIFGKSMDELTQGEQSSVDYNLADIGKSLALGQLSGLVQGALQSSLGLDVVDIEGSDDWRTGSVTIGKYIARNLFLSYSRDFSMDRKSKISHPDNISLEYQIFKWLYLQAVSQGTNSGFDLIMQKKWK